MRCRVPGVISFMMIASEYGSAPMEQPALQILSFDERFKRSGMTSVSSLLNFSGVRKNSDTLIVRYSMNAAKSSLFSQTWSKYSTQPL